jgi:UDPglucose 6-dehydrogenase
VGAGTVGRATGVGLISKGNQVAFVDPDFSVQAVLRDRGLRVVDLQDPDVRDFEVIMLAVPTPTIDGHMDHRYLVRAGVEIGNALRESSGYKVVCVRSTVLPTTTRNLVIPSLEKGSERMAGSDFGVCVNPEFLREANALDDFLQPDRILIGELDERSGRLLESLYDSFQRPILRCRLEEAEFAKYAANSFLATKISFFNEISGVCEKFGADPRIVSLAVAMDKRIGSYGTVGGTPYGGKCLPKDVDALLNRVDEMGDHLEVLSAAARINKRMETLLQVESHPDIAETPMVQDAK